MTETDEFTLSDEIRGHFKHHERLHHNEHSDAELEFLIRDFRVKATPIPANNVLWDVNNFAPEKLFYWDVLRVSVQTFTGGTVNVFQDSLVGDQLLTFSNPGSYWFEPHQLLIKSRNDILVFQGVTLSGTAYVSISGISVHRTVWARYLMGG